VGIREDAVNPVLVGVGLFLVGLALIGDSKKGAKRSHDQWFDRWVMLKGKLGELQGHKNELYQSLKSGNLSKEEKRKGHEHLAALKRESQRLRALKEEAHREWQASRSRLLR